MRITAVTCVKNEGPFVLEWIAHNRVIGVTDFLFYSNDCRDGTDRLLDRLAQHGICTHLPNPAANRNLRLQALKSAKTHPLVGAADWIWIADVDEFLNIHAGDHSLPALISACGDPQAISVSVQYMANGGANGGVAQFNDTPVTAQFTHSHNPDIWCAQTALPVKTLVRNDFPLDYFEVHRPFHDDAAHQPHWTDGSGRAVMGPFRKRANRRRVNGFPAKGARQYATLNHYALRSLDSFLVKADRGDAQRENRSLDAAYWSERNDAAYQDTSITRYAKALAAEMTTLKALDGVAALHKEAVTAHRQLIDTLLAQPAYAALRETLRSAPPYCAAEMALRAELDIA